MEYMMSARNVKRHRRCGGFSLVELSVSVFIAGVLLVSFNQVFGVAVLLYQRVRAQELAATQIDPIKAIFQTHVRACRFALYDNLADAEVGGSAGLLSNGDSTANPGLALRCVRRDGAGVFIIYWDAAHALPLPLAGTADPGIYLVTSTVPGNPTTAAQFHTSAQSIPLSNSVTFWSVDTRNGFADVSLRIASPFIQTDSGGNYIYSRGVGAGNNDIQYNFRTESTL
jgi:prepilin-type N-terminal cleavage/methylation domain-containing protein